MIDLRPVLYVIGLILAFMGASMAVPMLLDLGDGHDSWRSFLMVGMAEFLFGLVLAASTRNSLGRLIDLRQGFVLTTMTWIVAPLAGALPLMAGFPGAGLTDAYFEAMSGMTTTGATVLTGLDAMPRGVLMWRAMLNWFGGLGIVIVIMIFLPVMRVGGMQFFRAESFDTFGKVLPRARDIARSLLLVYVALTVACALVYAAAGMGGFDAITHAMSTIATGGFSTRDASFAAFPAQLEWFGALFMFLASLPYVRYVQLAAGRPEALWRDPQVVGYSRYLAIGIALVVLYRMRAGDIGLIDALRNTTFNLVSVMSSTGFSTAYLPDWGDFPLVVALVLGFIGACSGSSAAGLGVFRVQIMFGAVRAMVRRVLSPNRVVGLRYDGRVVEDEVLFQIMAYFTAYIVATGVLTILAASSGMDLTSALFAIWTSIGNIGVGVGNATLPSYTMADVPAFAKWLMILAMLLGRLGILSVLVLLLPRFWRG